VQGVHRWNDRELTAPGPVTRRLKELWAAKEAEGIDP
jgi:branched-chain amino acid aminotransferase